MTSLFASNDGDHTKNCCWCLSLNALNQFVPSIPTEIELNLKSLEKSVLDFIQIFKHDHQHETMIYQYWDAKDVLGHVTFWHESFARNLKALVEGKKPNPLEGKLSEVNEESVRSTRDVPVRKLIARLRKAQRTVKKHITNESIGLIPYRKGSRAYSRLEHLEVVNAHINKHLKDLKAKIH